MLFVTSVLSTPYGTSLVARTDCSQRRAMDFAKEHVCVHYGDLGKMLTDPHVEVVTIAFPSGAYLNPAVAAARSRKHVTVEEPPEIALHRCDQTIQECEADGVKLATIFSFWFHKSCTFLSHASRSTRLSVSWMVFFGSREAATMARNSLRRIYSRITLRRLTCKGRLVASSHGESPRSTRWPCSRRQPYNFTSVCIQSLRLYTATLVQTFRTCCCPAPHTSFTSWKSCSFVERSAYACRMSTTLARR